jgi:hypothetical protein
MLVLVIESVSGLMSPCDPKCSGNCDKRGMYHCDQTCVAGYGLYIGNFTCQPCEPACNGSCNIRGPGTCDVRCNAGYTINITSRHCQLCAEHCVNCSVSAYLRCDVCEVGYVIDVTYKTCLQCDANCAVQCLSAGTCPSGSCKTGFVSSLVLGSTSLYYCSPSPACDANCAGGCATVGNGKCDSTCISGFSLNTTSGKCMLCARNCTSGCSVEGAGFCDNSTSPCAFGTAWSPALNDPTGTKHACYPCARFCLTGCQLEGKGCCDSPGSCSSGTYGISTNPTCHVCL